MTAAITDFTQYAQLRAAADRNDPEALRAVAGQFEALFLQTMLKSMRDASLAEPLFGDSDSLEMYEDMMDKQLAVEMASGKGIGLADMIVRQLSGDADPAVGAVDRPRSRSHERSYNTDGNSVGAGGAFAGIVADRRTEPVGTVDRPRSVSSLRPDDSPSTEVAETSQSRSHERSYSWNDAKDFAKDVWPHVKRVAKTLNVAPVAILAQAALETGWGKHVMPDKDGGNSLNLFGIKAGRSWQGESVSKQTLEFDAGVAKRETARFRAYDDLASTFDDYADFIGNNPRYADVPNQGAKVGGFAQALQDGGYATDPEYARKITRVAESPLMKQILDGLKNDVTRSITHRLAPASQSTRL